MWAMMIRLVKKASVLDGIIKINQAVCDQIRNPSLSPINKYLLKFNRSVIRFLAPCLYNLINLVFCVQFTLLKLLIWASSLPNYESAFYNFVIKVRQPKKFKIKRCQTFAITSRKMRISRQRTDIFFTLRLAIYKEHRFLLIFQRMIIILS